MYLFIFKKEGWLRRGLNISYLTSSPKPLHWLKNKLDGKQVPVVFSHVCLFWSDQSVFYQFHFSFLFKENTCIFKHSVRAPQLSSNRINKNSQYMKLIGSVIGRARIRNCSPEGSTEIVIITHNRVFSAVNNNLNDVCYDGGC